MLEDVIAILSSTPEKLRREIATMSPRQMRTRPAPEKWSVQEVLAHLEDVELVGMQLRVQAIVDEDNPQLPRFDQEARAIEKRYNKRDPRRALERLTQMRRENVKWLRKLRPNDLKRRGVHQQVGEVSAGEMIHEWAFHDLGHLKQILEIKRYVLFPRIGNMRQFYRLQ